MAMEPVIGILHLEALYASVTHEKKGFLVVRSFCMF